MYYIKLILIYGIALIPLVISVLPALSFFRWGLANKDNIWLRTLWIVVSIVALAVGLCLGMFFSFALAMVLFDNFL